MTCGDPRDNPNYYFNLLINKWGKNMIDTNDTSFAQVDGKLTVVGIMDPTGLIAITEPNEAKLAEPKFSEFQVHKLNADGLNKAQKIADLFKGLLENLYKEGVFLEESRELLITCTKLEEACFFAKKAMANDPINQE